MSLALFSKPLGEGDRLLDFKVGSGTGKNEVSLPTVGKGKSAGYKTTRFQVDLKQSQLTLSDGSSHDLKTRVLLSGTVRYVPHFQGGFSHMQDPMHKDVELYPFSLESIQLDAAP